MGRYNRYRQAATAEEFFSINTEKRSKKELAEYSYILIHTLYLKEGLKIKSEIAKRWEQYLGVYMTPETYEYMVVNQPILVREGIVKDIVQGNEITSSKYLYKTIVALEFDLWLIERYRKSLVLDTEEFHAYLRQKYGEFLETQYTSFIKKDLMYIEEFNVLAEKLAPYYGKIFEFLNQIIRANRMKIHIERFDSKRTMNYKDHLPDYKDNLPDSEISNKFKMMQMKQKESEAGGETAKGKEETEEKKRELDGAGEIADLKSRLNEYEVILREKEKRIEMLEQDIREFKRQRDEAREYSVNQYDKGIRDFFAVMNDVRYGKIIDYLYFRLYTEDTDEILFSYLDNLFMALEDIEIEPIHQDDTVSIKEENIAKAYNLNFDKANFDPSKVKVKYRGWKYKDIILEKPTLELKE